MKKEIINKLFDELTEKYKSLIQDLYNGYSLKESYICDLWERVQLIDYVRFNDIDYGEFIKLFRRYV